MKVLFSSDLHGDMDAYQSFSRLLHRHDCGVLAGDLLDEFLPISDAKRYGLFNDSEPEELHDENFDEVAELELKIDDALKNPESINRKGLEKKRQKICEILSYAQKPIYYVIGNHDIANWIDYKMVKNLQGKRIQIGEFSIYGIDTKYKGIYGTFKYSRSLKKEVDDKTILVSHIPPHGILDHTDRDGSIGSKEVLKLIKKAKPLYCLFGHVHEEFGIKENMINGSWFLSRKFISLDLGKNEISILDPEKS